MSIRYVKADLFSTDMKYIAHGCNSMGVMGSGVAKLVKEKYPEAYEDYRQNFEACDAGSRLPLGYVYPIRCHDGKTILNCITQEGFGRNGNRFVSYDAVDHVFGLLEASRIGSVAIPKIGAGLGGGDWNVIESIILSNTTGIHGDSLMDVVVYDPEFPV